MKCSSCGHGNRETGKEGIEMVSLRGTVVDSPLGQLSIDVEGSPVAAVRMDPAQAYVGVPGLLRSVINEDDAETW